MDLALWLHQMGLSAPVAALWATLGVAALLTLLGTAFVAYMEGWGAHSHRPPAKPRGATRLKPGQPGKV